MCTYFGSAILFCFYLFLLYVVSVFLTSSVNDRLSTKLNRIRDVPMEGQFILVQRHSIPGGSRVRPTVIAVPF